VTRYRGRVAYDGTDFFGFQRQAQTLPTIQGTIEEALAHITGQKITVIGAGRTDTGVHATGQVIAFDVTWRHSATALWRALNVNLPSSIALQALDEAEPDFHPRFDARSRAYEYQLYVAPVRQPVFSRYAWHVMRQEALNTSAMRSAAGLLLGEHNFATFGQPPQGENTVREVLRSEMIEGASFLHYRIEANAFLYRMVRRIVGALVRVGSGKLSVDEFEAAFRAANGSWKNEPAPAQGLCLIEVTY
jgi:tRNA pseudouridine38-40 synthase